MDGAESGKRGEVFRHIVDLAVRDEDGAGNAVTRDVSHQAFKRGDKVRAVGIGVGFEKAQLQRCVGVHALAEGVEGAVGNRGALAEAHAFGTVDDEGGDGGQGLALLADVSRVRQGGGEHGEGGKAGEPGCAAPSEIGGKADGDHGEQRPEDGPAEQRVETDASGFGHCGPPSWMRGMSSMLKSPSPSSPCPRRSSRAGMWTWSSL